MEANEIHLLKKALERQKKARLQAEKILEEKSKELYDLARHLKESNNLLQGILNEKTPDITNAFLNIIDPYVVMDLNFNVITMNDSAKEFLGFDHTKEAVNLSRLTHKDYVAYNQQSISSLLEMGVLKNYRAKIITKKKEEKWVQINGSIIYNRNREAIAAQGIIRDITQEIEIKELVGEQKKQLNIIVENSPLGILLSTESKIIKANPAFTKLLGYTENELRQLGVERISEPEDANESEEFYRLMRLGQIDQFTIIKRYFTKSGQTIMARTSISTVKNVLGNVEYEVAIIEDITGEREAEERIKAERSKYSGIIANMNLGLLELDNNGVIQLTNQSFCRMSGYGENELLGKKVVDVLGTIETTSEGPKPIIDMVHTPETHEIELKDRQGIKKHWLVSVAPRLDLEKNTIGTISIYLDITSNKLLVLEKESLLKRLEESNRGLQEYAHIVSHDLKSPLRSISALATWIEDDYQEVLDERGKYNLQLMQEKLASMDKLITGILEYSTAKSSALENMEVDLNKVINEIKATIYIPKHVSITVPKRLPKIYADTTKMRQLFQNLISNAVQHIEKENGYVEVMHRSNGTHWIFTIKDNGVGIPKEYHQKIFEIFQSANDKANTSTGIGLSIVKKIVERYAGQVWVTSEPHQGTEFHFSINKDITSYKL